MITSRWRTQPRLPYLIFLLLAVFAPIDCLGLEHIVTGVVLNSEDKGEYFVYLTSDGDYLMSKDDLVAIGFEDPAGKTTWVNGKVFVSLRSMEGVSFTFNDKTLSLEIMAAPGLFRKSSIDLRPKRRTDVYYPKDTSAFFNYGMNYTGDGRLDYKTFTGTTQFGARSGDFLFLNDSTYTNNETGERLVRLMTNITHESRLNFNRGVLGDLYASSGYLGSAVNIGGLSFSRNFNIDPYFIKQPMVDYTGFATLPSEVKVSIDGTQIRSDKVSPGRFDLRNILSFSGTHDLEITIKDAFGREQTLRYPFYMTDILLREGLQEFSYNAGFLREDYGATSNDYGKFVCSFFHNYGITNSLTVGVRGEGLSDLANVGPKASFLLKNYGIVSLSTGASFGSSAQRGYAASLSYTYQQKNINLRFLFNSYSEKYSTILTQPSVEKTRYELGAGIGYGTNGLGSISFDYAVIKKYTGQDRDSYTVNYSRNITRYSNIYLSVNHTRDYGSNTRFTLGLVYYPWNDITFSLNLQKDKDNDTQTLQVQKSAPVGEGYGYRASVSRTNTPYGETRSINPYGQYNGSYGICSAEFTGNYPTRGGGAYESINLAASGSIAYVERTVAFGRPISDSYGVVKVGDLKGVAVYHSNLLIGHTNGSGKVFVPNMNSYIENYIAIDDKDIPVEYSLEKVSRYVSPPFKSGTFLSFDAIKVQAFIGRMQIRVDGKTFPVELREATLPVNGKKVEFITARDGEFYLENIPPGRYRGTLPDGDKTRYFDIVIPRSDESIVNLGGVLVESHP